MKQRDISETSEFFLYGLRYKTWFSDIRDEPSQLGHDALCRGVSQSVRKMKT